MALKAAFFLLLAWHRQSPAPLTVCSAPPQPSPATPLAIVTGPRARFVARRHRARPQILLMSGSRRQRDLRPQRLRRVPGDPALRLRRPLPRVPRVARAAVGVLVLALLGAEPRAGARAGVRAVPREEHVRERVCRLRFRRRPWGVTSDKRPGGGGGAARGLRV